MKVSDSQLAQAAVRARRRSPSRRRIRTGWARSRTTRRSAPTSWAATTRVADEVARYIDLGFKTFILDIPPSEEELDHTAVVFRRRLSRCVAFDVAAPGLRCATSGARDQTPSRSCMGEERLTYGELEELESNRLARLLAETGLRRAATGSASSSEVPGGDRRRCSATLKAGCAYVPIDTREPRAARGEDRRGGRTRASCCDGSRRRPARRPARRQTRSPTLPSARSRVRSRATGGGRPSTRSDADALQRRAQSPRRRAPTRRAHLLFTSGSTGTPKGVVITHANVVHFVDWATALLRNARRPTGSRATPRCTSTSRPSTSTATLSAGAELHLVPAGAEPDAAQARGVHPRSPSSRSGSRCRRS